MKAADTYLNSSQWSRPSGATQDVGLHLRLFGSGSDSLLLLHGLTASNLYFGAAYDTLGNHARVIVPDLLGFGRSPRPDDVDYGADAQVDALMSALDRIDANGSLYIAAHSAGTLVALRLATRRPDWVRGVIAFGPPLYPGPNQAQMHLARMGWWVGCGGTCRRPLLMIQCSTAGCRIRVPCAIWCSTPSRRAISQD